MAQSRLECVKKEIRSVLITAKYGLSLNEFCKTYKTLVGIRLPSREFGYTSDIDFLYSVPGVVRIKVESNGTYQLYCIANEATKHIQKLISSQKVTKKTKAVTSSYKLKPPIVYAPKNIRCHTRGQPFVPAKLRGEIIELLKNYPNGIGYACLVVAYYNIYKKRLNLQWLSEDPQEQLRKLVSVLPELEIKICNDQEKIFYLNHQSNKINCKEIPGSYSVNQQTVGKSLTTTPSASPQENERHFYTSAIPGIVKNRFDEILKKFPNGILAVHFPILYEKITTIPLDIHDLGFRSLMELALALPDIFIHVQVPGSLKDWILLHRDYSKNVRQILANYEPKVASIQMHSSNKASMPISSRCSLGTSNVTYTSPSVSHSREKIFRIPKPSEKISPTTYKIKNFVSDIALPTLMYTNSELPQNIANVFMHVFVSAITDPNQFWFQLQTEEARYCFNKLEEEIISFYSKGQLDNYKLADMDIKIGSSCVAYSSVDNHWYRAVITALPNDKYANVLLVDYGSWKMIHRSMLHYLKYKFITLPAYANVARLAAIKPSNQVWSKGACKKFISFCNSASIMAKVHSVYDNINSVLLCDTSKNRSIYINDVLVDKGFAKVDFFISCDKFSNYSSLVEKSLGDNILLASNHSMKELSIHDEEFTDDSGLRHSLRNETVKSKLQQKKLFSGSDSSHSPSKERKYVKNVALGDDYSMNIILVDNKAYVSSGDLCDLFWSDEAEVLDLRLKRVTDVLIPTISILEKDFKELFSQCKKNAVKGIKETGKGNYLVLYHIKDVMKVLNLLGHPSLKVRETICKEMQIFDPNNKIWEEFQDLNEENLNENCLEENDAVYNRLCLSDLKAKLDSFIFKSVLLFRTKGLDNTECMERQEKISAALKAIRKQIEKIKSICSKYAAFSS